MTQGKSRQPRSSLRPYSHLQLESGQVRQHLSGRNPGHPPQRGEVQGAGQAIGKAEAQHGGDPAAGVLESKAGGFHLVLLDSAALQVVHAALGVDLGLVGSRSVGQLGTGQDVEVVVGGVSAGVAFSSNSRA
jgi:hypothetical protein